MYPSECVFVLCSFARVIHPQSKLAWVNQPASDEWGSEWDKLSSLIIKKSDFQWLKKKWKNFQTFANHWFITCWHFSTKFSCWWCRFLSHRLIQPPSSALELFDFTITWWRHQLCRISLVNSSAVKPPCEVVKMTNDIYRWKWWEMTAIKCSRCLPHTIDDNSGVSSSANDNIVHSLGRCHLARRFACVTQKFYFTSKTRVLENESLSFFFGAIS